MKAPVARKVQWLGNSRSNVKKFPAPVQKKLGDALLLVQFGETPPSAKPFKGVGGVYEIVTDHRTDTYRGVYAVNIGTVVYVLHAFQKKSKKGRETPKQDVDLIRQRLQQAKRMKP